MAMFGFVNGSMASVTQRYITFVLLGKGGMENVRRVFSTALQIHNEYQLIFNLIFDVLPEKQGTSGLDAYRKHK